MSTVSFEFATATRIVFGAGRLAEAPEAVRALGVHKVLLVTGRNPERARPLREDLEVPGLARYGLTEADVPRLVSKARVASSMKANPLPLTDEELREIASRSL